MDLPTYTNIWRIEKRLYKLYDFRLPAPLPINWIAVFTGITVPYVVLLVAIGLPFDHSLVWLYVLPPGLLTWLTTRPVIESKRLPELLESQIRYLTEPRVWCRLAPLSEKDQIVVTARVWHSRRVPRQRAKAGSVALRERGTLARRNHGAAEDTAAAAAAMPAAASVVIAAAATAAAPGPARVRARARGEGAPGSAVRARSAAQRADTRTRVARPRPALEPSPASQPPVMDQPSTVMPAPASQPAASKQGRFRLVALRPRRNGSAPALPPAAVVTPSAGARHPRPADPAGLGHAGPALAVPVPSLGPVAAPFPSGMPAHATPDVQPAQPVRERGSGRGAQRIEVSHGEPGQRPVPPVSVPQRNPAHGWPVPALPFDQSQPAPPAPDVFAVSGVLAPETANKSPEPRQTPQPGRPQHADPDAEPPVAAPAEPPQSSQTPDTQPQQGQPQQGQQAQQAQTPSPVVKAVTENEQQPVPSIERALSGPSQDRTLSWHGKVKIVTGATQGPGARDQEALDRARARLPLTAPKRVLMLGCTSGAGQTVTTLLTGHILASLREQPVAAVDLHDGALARYGTPAGWLEEVLAGQAPEWHAPSRPDGLHPARTGTPARLDVIASRGVLSDGDEQRLAEYFGRHYPLTMLDPGAAGLTKLLKITDQLVVVVPASAEAAGALADTREWLDAHGFADLAAHSVTLINGVSRRSMADVAQAESVARGRCRAIVRVPWDDMVLSGPSALRLQTRVAYTALAGVLVAGMAAAPVRKQQ